MDISLGNIIVIYKHVFYIRTDIIKISVEHIVTLNGILVLAMFHFVTWIFVALSCLLPVYSILECNNPCSLKPPGGLAPADTPQMILISYTGGITDTVR